MDLMDEICWENEHGLVFKRNEIMREMFCEGIVNPRVVVVLSGKRKSGKDYLAERIVEMIGYGELIRISEPLKEQFSEMNQLDFSEILTSSGYKELYRDRMIKYGEDKRKRDGDDVFCKESVMMKARTSPLWIIVDCRRVPDILYFLNINADIILLRVIADQQTRISRDWIETETDTQPSETALDFADSDERFNNIYNNSQAQIEEHLSHIITFINTKIK